MVIKDVSTLPILPISRLYLRDNDISSIDSLRSSTPLLRGLDVRNNTIESISILSHFAHSLDSLWVSHLDSEKLSIIERLSNLRRLTMEESELEDVSFISHLGHTIESLDLSNNNLTDISAIARFDDLVSLDISS